MHVNNEADGYRYMYYESQEGHLGLYGHLEKLNIGIDRMAISKLMIMQNILN